MKKTIKRKVQRKSRVKPKRPTKRAPKRKTRAKAKVLKPVSTIELDLGEQGTPVQLALDRKLKKQGWWFDRDEADRVCHFIETYCRHSKGQWANRLLHLEPWQLKHVRRLFGWRRSDGTRRYRRTAWWLPRKNGKSTLIAAIALYLTMADGEAGAEVYSAASDAQQAMIVFNEAKNMCTVSPELSQKIAAFKSAIFVPDSGSVYRAITSKAGTKHGLNVHAVVIDELHALKNRELYDVLTSASGSRVQPLEVIISTAGSDIGSFAYEMWDYSIKVRDGVLDDPEFLPVVYCAEAGDDWRDEATWAKANPNLGVSINVDFLRGELAKTKGMPSRVAAFKQLYLNIWSQSAEAWLDLARWRDCLVKPRPIAEYRNKPCWGGLDLSSTTDLTALALLFEMDPEGQLEAVVMFWVPQDTAAEKQRSDDAQYLSWIDQGFIRATPGNTVDYDYVERDVSRVARYCRLRELAFDRWGAAQITQRLQDNHGIKVIPFGQGYRDMSPPSKELERAILSRGIRIVENPVLTWMASSVCIQSDPAANIKPVKRMKKNRIDGIVALIMAQARASLREQTVSVYASRGVIQV